MRFGLGLALGAGLGAIAIPTPAQAELGQANGSTGSELQNPMVQAGEGTLVMPFTDVSPDHWAYAALLNLAGVYGCVSGYPDGSFRGDTTVTRFEFAAGMNSCLNVLTEMATQTAQARDREVQSLIQSMEQSLLDLRQLDADLPAMP
ncbi:MAG: S-layer homology domain-containing protein [Leptolyngbya sp. DLM2.Bin27]|nr:MAG: S-layer homology domain-containing protein [Leptolyngbya sp. DLM2.Bin27]